MRIDVIDFPSDPNGELPVRLREKLSAALQRAAESQTACDKLEEVVRFTAKKLAEAKKEVTAKFKKIKDEQEAAKKLKEEVE